MLAAFCILVSAIGVYDIISPIPGAYRTTHPNVYNTSLSMAIQYEKVVEVLLENQTGYRFSLGADSKVDVNVQVVITSFLGENISIQNFQDYGGSISGEFVSNDAGNYTFRLTELDDSSDYDAYFAVDQIIVEYFPDGGRYASRNRDIKTTGGIIKIAFGIAFLVVIFWSKFFKNDGKKDAV